MMGDRDSDAPAAGRPFLMVGLLGLDFKKAVARGGKRRGKLTGGRWVTREGHHIYIRGGKVVAGMGVQAGVGIGAKPKPGGGGGGGTTAKPTETPKPAAKPTAAPAKPESAKPAPKPEPPPPKPAPTPKPAAAPPASKPVAKPEGAPKKPAPKPEPAKPAPAPAGAPPHTDPDLPAHKQYKAKIQEAHDAAIDKGGLAREVGMTPEQYKAHLDTRMKEAVDSGDMYVRVPNHILPNILEDGRFKTQFETGKSNAQFDPKFRKTTEAKMFGSREGMDDSSRPVYGYVSGKDFKSAGSFDEMSMAGYGNVVVKLKPHVKDRASVTVGDSLTKQSTFVGSPAGAPSSASVPISSKAWKKDNKEMMGIKDGPSFLSTVQKKHGYMEAQLHGGVKVSDIAEIAFGKDPHPDVVTHLKKLGIPYRVTKTQPF